MRRVRATPIIVLAVALAVVAMIFINERRNNFALGAGWCADKYQEALTASDTVRVDRLLTPGRAPAVTCLSLRQAGALSPAR